MIAFIIASADEVSSVTEQVGLPLRIALIGLVGTVGVAAMTFALSRWSEATNLRREGYSEATRELVAWAEYPFRIRRRISDEDETLRNLAERGHSHQEALRYREMWIRSENRWVASIFGEVRIELTKLVGPACTDAWSTPPVADASGMAIGPWGPIGVDELIDSFERAAATRFGWRRIAGVLGWHPGA